MVSKKIIRLTTVFILSTVILLVSLFLQSSPSYAQGPSQDSACRNCHGTTDEEVTLPSGEVLSVQIPLGELDASPHNAGTDVACVDCHRPRANYQYPHEPVTYQSQRELVTAVSERCEVCHYPHSPLHNIEEPSGELPVCADCHGSHQIDYADNVLNSMPNACVACHTDQTVEWAADYVAPRQGLGQGAEGYVGSDRCAGCHDEKYYTWKETLHAKIVQDPVANPDAVVGDFGQDDPDLTFSLEDTQYIIGNRWKQQYITQTEDGNLYVLPAQWNIETQEWIAYNPDTWQDIEWRENCSFCHVTGLDTETWGLEEFGVGCESCHGPGAEHVADPENVKPFAQVDDQVCGSCHSQGTSPDGHPFPATYRPGDTLTDHFAFTTDEAHLWPDGSAKTNGQQYTDWLLGSPMALSEQTNCVTCHAVHDGGIGKTQLHEPLNDLCLQCHNDKKAIINHVPFHDKAVSQHEFVCSDCHMPTMATSAVPYDIHNHSFLQPNPQASIDHGGVENMPNACNTCHQGVGQGPEWAVQTIEYVAQTRSPAPVAFAPGPTPTSPPPPTPIASVGISPEIDPDRIEAGFWVKWSFIGIVVLMFVAVVAVWIIDIRGKPNG